MAQEGLRERKKRETRQRISDVATEMFLARGFDNVTVAEVAEVAEVAKMTVFNYFPRKEDLLFHRDDEAVQRLTDAVTGRPPGQSVLAAVHGLLTELLDDGDQLVAVGQDAQRFYEVLAASPTLRVRGTELMQRLEDVLATLIAETSGPAARPMPRVLAALAMSGWRTAYRMGVAAVLAGSTPEQVRPQLREMLDELFSGLQRGFPE